VEGDNVRK